MTGCPQNALKKSSEVLHWFHRWVSFETPLEFAEYSVIALAAAVADVGAAAAAADATVVMKLAQPRIARQVLRQVLSGDLTALIVRLRVWQE